MIFDAAQDNGNLPQDMNLVIDHYWQTAYLNVNPFTNTVTANPYTLSCMNTEELTAAIGHEIHHQQSGAQWITAPVHYAELILGAWGLSLIIGKALNMMSRTLDKSVAKRKVNPMFIAGLVGLHALVGTLGGLHRRYEEQAADIAGAEYARSNEAMIGALESMEEFRFEPDEQFATGLELSASKVTDSAFQYLRYGPGMFFMYPKTVERVRNVHESGPYPGQ
ncbi:MAG: M48 family metalloprotease [Bdellovibrionales bacterium]